MAKKLAWWLVAAGAVVVLSCSDRGRLVTEPEPPTIDSFVLNLTAATIYVGESIRFTATARDTSGSVIICRPVTWTSSDTSVVTISPMGRTTAVALGSATITATCEGKSATAEITVTPVLPGRSILDRPDDLDGPQVHVMYVIPSDGADRQLDVDGTLARSVASFHNWFSHRTNGLAFRFDTYQGELDITFFRLPLTSKEALAGNLPVLSHIRQALKDEGRYHPDKITIVYYDGTAIGSCGNAEWPGRIAVMYLDGIYDTGSCGFVNFVKSPTQFPGYWEFAMLHDLLHTLGIVSEYAPNHAPGNRAHVPERNDLMYSGPEPWIIDHTTVVDVDGDDYFGPNVLPGIPRLDARNPFLTEVDLATLPPLEPPTTAAAGELARLSTALPPHPPFR